MSEIKQTNSIVGRKSYAFALEIISIYKYLIAEKKEFVLSKQLLRSGTSIGTNVQEGISSESKRDFVHKLSIALKEAKETSYWLSLLKDSNYLAVDQFDKLNNSCCEIIRILSSIILTTKAKYFSKSTSNS
jgi:four helix bundle protein